MKMKYIMYETEMKGDQILIFGVDTKHNVVSGDYKILSAGFIDVDITKEH